LRADLPLGVSYAQLVHAAGESAKPLPQSGTHAVVLAAKNEDQLLQIAEKLHQRRIPHVLIEEPDPPFCGQATAIGLYPTQDRKQVRRVLSRLPLLKGDRK